VWLHEHATQDASLTVRGPRNHFSLCDSPAYTFVAAGIGITPLLPMIESADARGAEWHLIYCGRRRASMSYLPELERYGDRVHVQPRDECDRVDFVDVLRAAPDPEAVYVCGPESFIEGAESASEELSTPAPKVERFVPKTFDDSVDTSFEVELASDGRVIEIPADRTILQVLTENGVNVIASCQEGTCGTCETGIVSGTADHRDSVLTKEEQDENEYMMVCCSRSKCPRLVLDL
jgi:ferredoxin-NADP reductase